MRQIHQAGPEPRFPVSEARFPAQDRLRMQIAEAVESRTTPLSQLLRLMSALDAQGGDAMLRLQLRARIGAPLSA